MCSCWNSVQYFPRVIARYKQVKFSFLFSSFRVVILTYALFRLVSYLSPLKLLPWYIPSIVSFGAKMATVKGRVKKENSAWLLHVQAETVQDMVSAKKQVVFLGKTHLTCSITRPYMRGENVIKVELFFILQFLFGWQVQMGTELTLQKELLPK